MLLKYLSTILSLLIFTPPLLLRPICLMNINHWTIGPMLFQFLKTLNKKKAVAKANDSVEIMTYHRQFWKIATLYEFLITKVTVPSRFSDAEDYYAQSSSAHFCQNIQVPFIGQRLDDSFPCTQHLVSLWSSFDHPSLHFLSFAKGGHVGFASFWFDNYWSNTSYIPGLRSSKLPELKLRITELRITLDLSP